MHRAGPEPKLSDELTALVHSGVAVTVATRDADLKPAVTRAWGTRLSEDGQAITLCAIAPPGSATRANLEENGAIAVGFSPPTIARAVQIKGSAVEIGEPGPDELERAQHHFDAFRAEAEMIGISGEFVRRLFVPLDFLAVTFSIEEVFEQTPGPTAGKRL